MNHQTDYFRDEVRNGFYVPTCIKQAWAAELDVLGEIDRICEKHGIMYFADWGTFLGAVRHGGFVPWDDDLDICMKRDDYEKFRKVADQELPKQFVIHDYARKEDHWLFLARVVQNSRICFEEEHLEKYHNFPWLSGVDIFLQDYLYRDEEKERRRCKDVMKIIAIADAVINQSVNKQALQAQLNELKKRYSVNLSALHNRRALAVALYRLAEEQMAKVRPEESDMLGQIFPWILKGRQGQPKVYYEQTIRLPFEDTTIPVPVHYNTLLASRYGNYQEIHKVWKGHTYPFFEAQKEGMERMAGKPLPGFSFTFSPDMKKRAETDKRGSLKKLASECMEELAKRQGLVAVDLADDNAEGAQQLLIDCQQLAVELGTLIEQGKGEEREGTKVTVGVLETYCEVVYRSFQGIDSGSVTQDLPELTEAFSDVRAAVQQWILDRREVLFLPIGPKEWRGLSTVYESAAADFDTDVYVVPLPLMTKDPFGQVAMTNNEIQAAVHLPEYPEGIAYTDWQTYDVSLHCPDMVYIQNPYDGENPYLTVPSDFFAKNLQAYTDKLVYIPFAFTAEFGEEDINDQYNMKHYVTAPGVIYADQVMVQSENMKEQYVNKLTAFAGEDTVGFWEEKILPFEIRDIDREEERHSKKKRLLYCVGANELSEHGDVLVASVRDRLQNFEVSREGLSVSVSLYPSDRKAWSKVNETLSARLFSMLDEVVSEKGYEVREIFPADVELIAGDYDAYYGSPSPVVPVVAAAHKPVMLVDYGARFN